MIQVFLDDVREPPQGFRGVIVRGSVGRSIFLLNCWISNFKSTFDFVGFGGMGSLFEPPKYI